MKTAHFLAVALAACAGALPALAQGTTKPAAPAAPVAAAPAAPAAPGALEAIRARGHLLCGVSPATPGFAALDPPTPLTCPPRASAGPSLAGQAGGAAGR